jgi:hypothetical protein
MRKKLSDLLNKPIVPISLLRHFNVGLYTCVAVVLLVGAAITPRFISIMLAFAAGWVARSSRVYYEPGADPIAQIDRENNQRN